MKSNQILLAFALLAGIAIVGFFAVKYVETKANADDEAREDQKQIATIQGQQSFYNRLAAFRYNNLSRPTYAMHWRGFHHHHPTAPPSA